MSFQSLSLYYLCLCHMHQQTGHNGHWDHSLYLGESVSPRIVHCPFGLACRCHIPRNHISSCKKNNDEFDSNGKKWLTVSPFFEGLTCSYCSWLRCHQSDELLPRRPLFHHHQLCQTQKTRFCIIIFTLNCDLYCYAVLARGFFGQNWRRTHCSGGKGSPGHFLATSWIRSLTDMAFAMYHFKSFM